MKKTLAQAMADMKVHNCAECEDTTCKTHFNYQAPTAEQMAARLILDEKLATEKMVKMTIDYIKEDESNDTVVNEGFCVAGIMLVGDDLNGGFEALNFATGAFSEDRLEATIQGLEQLISVLKARKVAAMLANRLR